MISRGREIGRKRDGADGTGCVHVIYMECDCAPGKVHR